VFITLLGELCNETRRLSKPGSFLGSVVNKNLVNTLSSQTAMEVEMSIGRLYPRSPAVLPLRNSHALILLHSSTK
jgi:hypothetical protein